MQNEDAQINHPQHYCQGKREVITLTEQLDFCFGNACKYILRAPFKGMEARDLKKARWYIQRMMQTERLPTIPSDAIHMVKDFENPLLEAVFDVVIKAAIKEDASLLEKAVQKLTDQIKEIEYGNMQKELRRCKEMLREVRQVKEEMLSSSFDLGGAYYMDNKDIPLSLIYPWLKL